MTLAQIKKQCTAIRELCTEQYRYMSCVRKYLHDFDALELINKIDPCCIIRDSHEFCTTYAECEEVNIIVQRFLEAE